MSAQSMQRIEVYTWIDQESPRKKRVVVELEVYLKKKKNEEL